MSRNEKYPQNEKICRPCQFLKSNHILFNPRYITDPAKSKTDSWANVYREECIFSLAQFPHPDSTISFSFNCGVLPCLWCFEQKHSVKSSQTPQSFSKKLKSLKVWLYWWETIRFSVDIGNGLIFWNYIKMCNFAN